MLDPQVSAASWSIVLRFLYTGFLELEGVEPAWEVLQEAGEELCGTTSVSWDLSMCNLSMRAYLRS